MLDWVRDDMGSMERRGLQRIFRWPLGFQECLEDI
jgi:hypothetical protein